MDEPGDAVRPVQVVRKRGSDPADPTDGTASTAAPAPSFSDTGLTNGTIYHYGVWVAPRRRSRRRPRVSATPNVPARPGDGPEATPGDLKVDLAWTNPTTRFDQRARRPQGRRDRPPTRPTARPSTAARARPSPTRASSTAPPTTTRSGRQRGGLLLHAGPARPRRRPRRRSSPVTNLKATAGNGTVALSWTNPTIRFDRVARRPQGRRGPARSTDGTEVTAAPATLVTDTGLYERHGLPLRGLGRARRRLLGPRRRPARSPFDPASVVTYTAQPTGDYAGLGSAATCSAPSST